MTPPAAAVTATRLLPRSFNSSSSSSASSNRPSSPAGFQQQQQLHQQYASSGGVSSPAATTPTAAAPLLPQGFNSSSSNSDTSRGSCDGRGLNAKNAYPTVRNAAEGVPCSSHKKVRSRCRSCQLRAESRRGWGKLAACPTDLRRYLRDAPPGAVNLPSADENPALSGNRRTSQTIAASRETRTLLVVQASSLWCMPFACGARILRAFGPQARLGPSESEA